MNILIACEESGTVRDAFIKKGHNAISCDILETSNPGPHIAGDVLPLLEYEWDLVIAHPPCTYLSNSGVTWLYKSESSGKGWPNPVKFTKERNEERWKKMEEAALFFDIFRKIKCERVCIENPIPHKYGIGKTYSQIIQPWQFGHPEQKATCLWLKGLPELVATNNVKVEMEKLSDKERQRLHYLPPGKDRAKIRSKTFQGIADAMAEQWGKND